MSATYKESSRWPGVDLSLAQQCVDSNGRAIIISLMQFEKVSAQLVSVGTTALSTGSVAMLFSNSPNGPWVASPNGPAQLSAAGIFAAASDDPQIDVSAFAYMTFATTTAQAGTAADFHVCGFGHK